MIITPPVVAGYSYVRFWPLAAIEFDQFWGFSTSGVEKSCHSARVNVRYPPQWRHWARIRLNDCY